VQAAAPVIECFVFLSAFSSPDKFSGFTAGSGMIELYIIDILLYNIRPRGPL
jgi:hypothetical protein